MFISVFTDWRLIWSFCHQHKKQEKLTPGVIFVGHLPPALQENQIRAYFSQFGAITRFRLSRSKRVRFLWAKSNCFAYKRIWPLQLTEYVHLFLLISIHSGKKGGEVRISNSFKSRISIIILNVWFAEVIASNPQFKLRLLVNELCLFCGYWVQG
jgi:hypothetical protein